MLASTTGGETRQVLGAGSQVLLTRSGYGIFARNGVLLAQRFDSTSGSFVGDAQQLAKAVWHLRDTFAVAASVAHDDTLLYLQPPASQVASEFYWYSLNGDGQQKVPHEPFSASGGGFDLSPDGRTVAVNRVSEDGNLDIWLMDAVTGTLTRVTADPRSERDPVWAPDGRSLVFNRDGYGLVRRQVGQQDTEELLLHVEGVPTQWSADGKFILYLTSETGPTDLWVLPVGKPDEARPIVKTPFNAAQGQLSMDSRWLAYSSDDTGGGEVYVQAFPSGEKRRRISDAGGHMPRWSRDGRTLYYVSFAGVLTAVRFNPETGASSVPQKLVTLRQRFRNPTFRYAVRGERVLSMDFNDEPMLAKVLLNWPLALSQ